MTAMPSHPGPRPFAPGQRVEFGPQGWANLSPGSPVHEVMIVGGYTPSGLVRIVDPKKRWLGDWFPGSLKAWTLRIGG